MQYDTVTPLIGRFNDLIDSLIKDFKEYKFSEKTLIYLANKTKSSINFTEVALMNVFIKVLENMGDARYVFDDEIKIITKMVDKIFEKINESLDVILEEDHEEGEEHVHEHGHDHDHEHNIDIESVQKDIDKILECLTFLKKILGDVGKIVISLLKYRNKEITEEEFNKEYTTFKENIETYKNEFTEVSTN